jgi:hypothetical protein
MLQFPGEAHRKSAAQVIQALNGISILDFMYNRKDVDKKRIGVNGGSGGDDVQYDYVNDVYNPVAVTNLLDATRH